MRLNFFSFFSFLYLALSPLFAAEHYARVEPWERTTLKAAASGVILEANLSAEGREVRDARVIHIDDRLDRTSLKSAQRSQKLIAGTLELTRQMLPGLEESSRRQHGYFERIRKLSTASQTQKDQAYQAMIAAENQFLSTKEQALNLEKTLLDLEDRIATLADRIDKKNITLKNRYLYRLMVRKGEYVTPGMPLAIVDDLRRAKLVLYLSREERKRLKDSTLWIQGKKSDLKITKVWEETDDKYLSSFRAEIPVPAGRYPFSSLLKVELK